MHRLMIIEDDLEFASILTDCLEADPEFMLAELATNMVDARERMSAGCLHNTTAVLVDINLAFSKTDPTINTSGGLELIREMRKKHSFSGTILVVTNSDSIADGERALDAGCDGYLCKHLRGSDLPILLQELRLALRGDVVIVSKELRHIFMRQAVPAQPELWGA